MRQDETGFAEFYRASHQRCLRAVIAGAGHPDLAEDLVAEAFTRALVSWRTVRDHPVPEARVVRTALNAGTSWWRRRRRRLTACGGAAGAGLAVSAALTLALVAPGAGPRVNPGGTAARAGTTGTANPAGTSVSLAAWSVRADRDGSVTVTLRELTDAAQLKQALAANGVPALLHFGGGRCSADRAPQRGPIGLARVRAAGGHLTFTMTFKVSLWPAGSELYIANGPLGPQMAVIPQGHYLGCA